MKQTIEQFANKEYRNYAKEVVFERALPSIVDGFKPVRRKIFYYMIKNSNNGFIRVSSIAGGLAEKCNYHHGESSAQNTIISMSKSFSSSNNLPILSSKGAFGSKLLPKSSAQARYIHSKYDKLMNLIFLDNDIAPDNKDLESPEPRFYLPIIPMFILNGISGIGFGFANKILPRDILETVKAVELCLKNKSVKNLKPFFNGCDYKIEELTEKSFQLTGSLKCINKNTVQVNELLPEMDRDKFINKLFDLQTDGVIRSFKDESKEDFKFIIKFDKPKITEDEAIKILDLTKAFHDNYTMIDDNDNIKIFNNISEIIDYFTHHRLKYYTKRKEYQIKKIESDVEKLEAVIVFIENLRVIYQSQNKEEIKEVLKAKISDNMIDYCLQKPFQSFLKKNTQQLKKDIQTFKDEIKIIESSKEVDLYLLDLKKLKKELK